MSEESITPDAGAEPAHSSPFEAIRQENAAGGEYWSARDLAKLLGYTNWRNFRYAVEKAKLSCKASGREVADHFDATVKMVQLGSGAARQVEDFHLSRYACYLLVQNADPAKPIVALGQTYFAVQTRRQELADALEQAALAGMTEDEKRLFVRKQLAEHNTKLAAAARAAGVITPDDYAVFQDHGYMGLYAGEKARDIHRRKGLKPNQKILDHMGYDELIANAFRSSLAEQRLRAGNVAGQDAANQVHRRMGELVRQTLAEAGVPMPETLPTPAESIQQLEQKARRRVQQGPQLAMFPEMDNPAEDQG